MIRTNALGPEHNPRFPNLNGGRHDSHRAQCQSHEAARITKKGTEPKQRTCVNATVAKKPHKEREERESGKIRCDGEKKYKEEQLRVWMSEHRPDTLSPFVFCK